MGIKTGFKETHTSEEGVRCIFGDGNLIGVIHNDTKNKLKRVYSVTEMSVEEIASLMEHNVPVKS